MPGSTVVPSPSSPADLAEIIRSSRWFVDVGIANAISKPGLSQASSAGQSRCSCTDQDRWSICFGGVFARDDAQPGVELPPLFKRHSVADRGDDCGRRNRSDAGASKSCSGLANAGTLTCEDSSCTGLVLFCNRARSNLPV